MKGVNYNIEEKTLKFATGSEMTFDFPIKSTIVVKDIIIILVEPPPSTIYNYNVFGMLLTGDFLWRIGQVELYYWGSNNCPYISVTLNDDNEVVLFNWCDTAVVINPQTGEVMRTYQTK